MSGVNQVAFMNQRSFGPPAAPAEIGAAYGGGFYAGMYLTGDVYYFLVICPAAAGATTNKKYQTNTTTVSGADSVIDGAQNTADLIAAATTHDAASFCNDINTGGYTDWYLPAKYEIEMLYFYFKPGTGGNKTTVGANIYTVPPRPNNYTDGSNGVPAPTTVSAFQSSGAEELNTALHWSSTETAYNAAWGKQFNTGFGEVLLKTSRNKVRAVRRVAA